MSNDLTIVTVADRKPTADYYTYDEFFASARKFGHEPLVLGQKPGEYKGLGSKPVLLQRAIKEGLIKTKFIIFCDCFDVVFQLDPALAHSALEYYCADIVWNAEKNCFPDANLVSSHPETHSSFRFLNSGFGVGSVDAFAASLDEMNLAGREEGQFTNQETLTIEHANDQDWWMRQHLFGKSCISALDIEALMCMTLCGVGPEEVTITPGRITSNETEREPVALHANGPSKTAGLLEPILTALGYPR